MVIDESDILFANLDPDSNMLTHHDYDLCRNRNISDYNLFIHSIDITDYFSIFNQNMQSFLAKKSTLESFISSINHEFSCLVLTETWNRYTYIDLCNLDGYYAVHTYRSSTNNPVIGGGVSVFAKNGLYNVKKIQHLSICEPYIETCATFMHSIKHQSNLIVIGVYRPPTGDIYDFVSKLESILTNPSLTNKTVVLAGDMNIDLTNVSSNHVNLYLSTLNSLNFYSTISQPTRSVRGFSNNDSLLDHIFINKLGPFNSTVFMYDISDHRGTSLVYPLSSENVNRNEYKKVFRPYSDSNFNQLEILILNTNWDNILGNSNCSTKCDIFIEYVNSLYCRCFPKKTTFMSSRKQKNPWVTAETKDKIKLRSELYKMSLNNEISKIEYNLFRNKLNKDIERDKNNYFCNLFDSRGNDIKNSWKTIRHLMGAKTQQNDWDKIFENCLTSDAKGEVLNNFNNFFSNIGNILSNAIPFNSTDPLEGISSLPNSFYLFPTSVSEICEIIKNLKCSKTQIDEMPIFIFKKLANILSYPLKILINDSFREGIFPDNLKVARITPIHKNGDYLTPSNFRPISSLSYICKIFEKTMSKRLLSFCRKFSIISAKQFGFQPGISTSNALIELTECIYDSLNDLKHNFTVLVDIRKAFDCVNHNILTGKLEKYGVRGPALRWFSSYLSNRRCFTKINNISSQTNDIDIGVPQGSVLGPILFLIYVNDIPKISSSLNAILYADDTTLMVSNPDVAELQNITNNELLKFHEWTKSNKLTINTDKTEFLIFSNRLGNTLPPILELLGSVIQPSNTCKYLGVVLDDKLNFREHIKCIIKKISRLTGILYKIKDKLPMKARLNYYYAFIYPYISYNILVWGATCPSIMEPLNVQHKRTIRIIANAGYRDHTEPIFKNLNLLKLCDIYKYSLLAYMHDKVSNDGHVASHNLNTRSRFQLRPKFHRLSLSQHAVSYTGPTEWNKLPENLKQIPKRNCFKRNLKKFIIDGYIGTL